MKLLTKLVKYQLKDIEEGLRIKSSNFLRLSKYLDDNFLTDKCCIWKGYFYKGGYYFFLHGNRISTKRLLYANYIGPIKYNQYIIMTCGNFRCCNVNHYKLLRILPKKRTTIFQRKIKTISIEKSSDDHKIILDFQ